MSTAAIGSATLQDRPPEFVLRQVRVPLTRNATAKLLFWYDPSTYQLVDRFVSYFGAAPLIVDPDGKFKRGRLPESVSSLSEALNLYPDHQWVFLDSRGDMALEHFDHFPINNAPTIYAIGHNVSGFGMGADELPGEVLRLQIPGEVWDYQVASMVLYSRFLQTEVD